MPFYPEEREFYIDLKLRLEIANLIFDLLSKLKREGLYSEFHYKQLESKADEVLLESFPQWTHIPNLDLLKELDDTDPITPTDK